jgi:hypothetical protein
MNKAGLVAWKAWGTMWPVRECQAKVGQSASVAMTDRSRQSLVFVQRSRPQGKAPLSLLCIQCSLSYNCFCRDFETAPRRSLSDD